MKKIIVFISFCIVVVSASVLGHGGATGVVKERMDLMDSLKGAMKALKPIFRGQTDYDVDVVKNNALVVRDNAAEHMTKLFPEGSLTMPSEAKSEIWSDWEEFVRLANDLERLGQALHDGAENRQGPGPRSGTLGGSGMMGGAGMMSSNDMGPGMMGEPGTSGHRRGLESMTDEQLAAMPAQGIFQMLANNCTDCHKQFRVKKEK